MATAKMVSLLVLALVALLPFGALGACTPQLVSSNLYSTSEKISSSRTVFVAEFSAKCSSSEEVPPLFAAVGDRLLPVVLSLDNRHYQVSWSEEHKKAPAGAYIINVYTEEGYAALRRAQRSGEDANVKATFSMTLHHPGASQSGLWLQTEFLALVSALLIWWFANNLKNKLSE